MTILVYKLTPNGYFKNINSYTLFGAFAWAYKLIYGEENLINFLQQFSYTPIFRLSSPLFFVKDKIVFLPKPIWVSDLINRRYNTQVEFDPNELDLQEKIKILGKRKDIKKLKYLSLQAYEELFAYASEEDINNFREIEIFDNENYKIVNKSFLISSNELSENLDFRIKQEVITKNYVNRIFQKSERVFLEEPVFMENVSFLVVVFFDENNNLISLEDFRKVFELGIKNGLGKNKNLGWGNFILEEINNEIIQKFEDLYKYDNTRKVLTLSPVLYNYAKRIFDLKKSFYNIESHISYVESSYDNPKNLIKPPYIYLSEGSILQYKDNIPANITYLEQTSLLNAFTIYQYGIEFPIKFGEG